MRKRFRRNELRAVGRRATAALFAAATMFATLPRGWALEPMLGTVQGKGVSYAATATGPWVKILGARPLVGGDRLRTGADGNLLADFGELGVVGLYDNTEVSVSEQDSDIVVEVLAGKAAFHVERERLKITARGSVIGAGTLTAATADGYVDFDPAGTAHVTVESDSLNVTLPGGRIAMLSHGERLALVGDAPAAPEVALLVGDERKAGPVEALPDKGRKNRHGLSARGWTALGAVVVAVGVGVGVGVGSDGGGGGGDTNGSGD